MRGQQRISLARTGQLALVGGALVLAVSVLSCSTRHNGAKLAGASAEPSTGHAPVPTARKPTRSLSIFSNIFSNPASRRITEAATVSWEVPLDKTRSVCLEVLQSGGWSVEPSSTDRKITARKQNPSLGEIVTFLQPFYTARRMLEWDGAPVEQTETVSLRLRGKDGTAYSEAKDGNILLEEPDGTKFLQTPEKILVRVGADGGMQEIRMNMQEIRFEISLTPIDGGAPGTVIVVPFAADFVITSMEASLGKSKRVG